MCGIAWNNYCYHQIHHLQSEIVQIRQQTTKHKLTHSRHQHNTHNHSLIKTIIAKSIYTLYLHFPGNLGEHVLIIKDFKKSHISRNNIGKGGVPVTVPACWHMSPGPSIPASSLHLYTNSFISSQHWSISLHLKYPQRCLSWGKLRSGP